MNIGPWDKPPEDPDDDGEEKYPPWVLLLILIVFGYTFWFVLIPAIFGGESQ